MMTERKRVKLKLDFEATATIEEFFTLVGYEVSEENAVICLNLNDGETLHTVTYSDIESVDFADNDERLKIWVCFKSHNNTQRFYVYYLEEAA